MPRVFKLPKQSSVTGSFDVCDVLIALQTCRFFTHLSQRLVMHDLKKCMEQMPSRVSGILELSPPEQKSIHLQITGIT